MRFMTAVFSYNRGQLLTNCVRSIELLSPPTSIVVFDDKSDEVSTLSALADIAERGHEIIVNDTASTARHGNYYENLNRAVHLARTRGFRLLHLFEDDFQFVRRSPELAKDVSVVFDRVPSAGQVSVQFWKFVSKASGERLPQMPVYRLAQSPACSLGFVDVDRLHALGFRFQADEAQCRKRAASLGLDAIAFANPVTTRVPWPMYARHREVKGARMAGNMSLLVKPLSDEDVRRLFSRDLGYPPYAEDFCVPWGWRCWKPYGWTASYATWIRSLLIVARHRRSIRGLVPRRVGDRG
jgi:hypothetical protein